MTLADTGLENQLAQVSSSALFEHAIALQLMRLGQINYCRLKTGQEIHFILDQRIAAEVKKPPHPPTQPSCMPAQLRWACQRPG